MALYARYNENGTKILCELKDISQLETSGYKYKESPTKYSTDEKSYEGVTSESVEKITKETVQPKSKTTRRGTRKSAQASNEKDIIL